MPHVSTRHGHAGQTHEALLFLLVNSIKLIHHFPFIVMDPFDITLTTVKESSTYLEGDVYIA